MGISHKFNRLDFISLDSNLKLIFVEYGEQKPKQNQN